MTDIMFATLVWQVIDFLRELSHLRAQLSAVVTQLTAWIGGILLTALGAHAAVTAKIVLPGIGQPLGKLDGASTVLVGLLVASLASSLVDTKQALDASDSAAKPALINDDGPGGA